MKKTTKITKIEKQYKDRKTGEYKSITIEYAKVNDRLLEFRQDNPRGSIVTSFQLVTDRIIFKSHIVKDRGDDSSAEATGHATGKDDGTEKVFEKLETIATGRALALLGYGAKGEIASSEEMEEFEAHKAEQMAEAVFSITESIGNCESTQKLKEYWASLSGELRDNPTILQAKDAQKLKLQNETTEPPTKHTRVARVAKRKTHGVKAQEADNVQGDVA